MTIKRIVNGEELEFELTDNELTGAYFEQQYLFDIQDVRDAVIGWEDDDVIGVYGINMETFLKLSDEMAVEMRRNIDKYDMDWDYAREEAICSVIRRNAES